MEWMVDSVITSAASLRQSSFLPSRDTHDMAVKKPLLDEISPRWGKIQHEVRPH